MTRRNEENRPTSANASLTESGLEIVQTEEVFTPSTVARKAYIDRAGIGERIRRELRVAGRPIALVGPYGCGKTTLAFVEIERMFPRHIHIICNESTTFEQLLLQAFDVLGPYYDEQLIEKSGHTPSLSAEFMGIKGQLGGKGHEETATEARVLPPQLTSRTLARFAASAEAPLVIDDIHKLADSEVAKVARSMREWQTAVLDTSPPKMVVIGTEQFTEPLLIRLMKSAPDLNRRLSSMRLSLMSSDELMGIITTGASLLNVDFSNVADMIVKWSHGYPGICHDLCFHVCYAAGVHMTSDETVKIEATHLQTALAAYVEDCSPAIQHAFDLVRLKPIGNLPHAFASLVFEKISARELDGTDLLDLQKSVAETLNCQEDAVLDGLVHLSDDTGVLVINPDTGLIQFKEPMYLACYQIRRAATTSQATRDAFISKFFEIMGDE